MKKPYEENFAFSASEISWSVSKRPFPVGRLRPLVSVVTIVCSLSHTPTRANPWEQSETLARPLFSETRRPAPKESLTTGQATMPEPLPQNEETGLDSNDLRLRGTISGQYDRIALIEHLPSGSMHKLRLGKTVIELKGGGSVGIETLSILHDRITINLDGNVILPLTPKNSS